MYARDIELGKKFKHKEYKTLLKVVDLDGEKVFLEEGGIVHSYVDVEWYNEVIEVPSDKAFYKDCLIDLNKIVSNTEIMVSDGLDNLTNLFAFRGRVSRLLDKINKEIDRRLD